MYQVLKLIILVWMFIMAPLPASGAVEPAMDKVISQQLSHVNIEVHYPSVNQAVIDADILAWVTQLIENFKESYVEESTDNITYELRINYSLLKSGKTLGLVWEVANYTGGAHGSMNVITTIYDLKTEVALELTDIFKNLNLALELMATYSQTALSSSLGNMYVEEMLKAGTTPDLDNFTSFILTPTGIRIFFSPYQVAPWAAGIQVVDMPLDELILAGPNASLWDR